MYIVFYNKKSKISKHLINGNKYITNRVALSSYEKDD